MKSNAILIGGLPAERWIGRTIRSFKGHSNRHANTAKLLSVNRNGTLTVYPSGHKKNEVVFPHEVGPSWSNNQDLKLEAEALTNSTVDLGDLENFESLAIITIPSVVDTPFEVPVTVDPLIDKDLVLSDLFKKRSEGRELVEMAENDLKQAIGDLADIDLKISVMLSNMLLCKPDPASISKHPRRVYKTTVRINEQVRAFAEDYLGSSAGIDLTLKAIAEGIGINTTKTWASYTVTRRLSRCGYFLHKHKPKRGHNLPTYILLRA